jgi:hypothetical protein
VLSPLGRCVPIKGIEPNDDQDMNPTRKPFLLVY